MKKRQYGQHPDQFIEVYPNQNNYQPNKWIILIHGGYWRQEVNADTMHPLVDYLIEMKFSVINIEYRRGENKWPIPHEDIVSAINFFQKSNFYSNEKIYSLGHFVGGQLSLLTSTVVDRVIAVEDYFGRSPIE